MEADNHFFELGCATFAEDEGKMLDKLEELGCHYLGADIGRKLDFPKLFESLARFDGPSKKAMYQALPLPNRNNIPFAGGIVRKFAEGEANVAYRLLEFINTSFSRKKYLISCARDYYFGFEFFDNAEALLRVIPLYNQAACICDEGFDKVLLFHTDLEFSVLSLPPSYGEILIGDCSRNFWIEHFQRHMLDYVVPGNAVHLSILNTNLVPRVEGLEPFAFLDHDFI